MSCTSGRSALLRRENRPNVSVMVNTRGARATHEPVYALAIGVGRTFFGGVLRLKPQLSGIENIPDSGGAVLAITHFGYMDFALTEWVTWKQNRRHIRFLATKGAFDKPVIGWLLRSMHHIPVDMDAGRDAYTLAVDALRSGELVGVFPEAGVSASFTVRDLKTGAARMAAEAGVPIVPVVVWGGQFLKTKNHRSTFREQYRAPIRVAVGPPLPVSGTDDPGDATLQLRERLTALLDEAQKTYPLPGAGQWWQPRHLGGTAPTPEEAAIVEAERQRKKRAARESAARTARRS